MTVVGVAYRGHIPLDDIEVAFDIEGLARRPAGCSVRKTVVLKGRLSEGEELRLRRTVEYCPVGKIFTKGSLAIEDRVETIPTAPLPSSSEPAAKALPAVPSGTVSARYLPQTRECAHDGKLAYEGEVDLHLTCANLTRQGCWALLAGHTAEGWVPPPVPLAYAALAASTAATVRQVLPAPAGFHVELGRESAGAAQGGTAMIEQAQADAVQGVVRTTRMARTVVLHGSASRAQVEAVESAVQREPLSLSMRDGGLLRDERIMTSAN